MSINAFHKKGMKNVHIWINSIKGYYKSHKRAIILTSTLAAAIAAGYYVWNHRKKAYVKKHDFMLMIGPWGKVEDDQNHTLWVNFSTSIPHKAISLDRVINADKKIPESYMLNEYLATPTGDKYKLQFVKTISPFPTKTAAQNYLSGMLRPTGS